MANISRGDVLVDTAYLCELAETITRISHDVQAASNRVNAARRHEKWHCSERYNVTNEVDNIHQKARKIASDMLDFASALRQGAESFESMQSSVISTLSAAELKSL